MKEKIILTAIVLVVCMSEGLVDLICRVMGV